MKTKPTSTTYMEHLSQKINKLIFGKNDQSPLERRLHILITFLSAIIIFVGCVTNILLKMNLWLTILTAAAFLIVVIFFIIARNSKHYQRSIIPLFTVSIFLLSTVWFLNAGYDGNIINLMIVYFMALYTIAQQKYRIIVFLTFLIMFSSLVVIQYNFPELILPYDNKEQRFVDLLFGNILYFVFTYLIIDIIIKNYTTENKEIFLINEQLKIKNEQIVESNLKIEESEERQRLILESLPVAIYTSPIDPEFDTTWISGDVKKITGFESEEYLSANDFWRNRIHPEDKDTVFTAYRNIPSKNEMILEYRWKCKDGQYHWFQDRSVLRENIFRKEYLGIIIDISERKRAEDELEESKQKYRGLSEAAFEAIFISEKGICIEQNQAAEKMFGYTSEEAIGRYGTEWIVPEDREMVMKNMIAGIEEPYEAVALRKDGTIFPCILHAKMMQYKGRNVRVTSLSDISERKRAEEALSESESKYRKLLECTPMPIACVNKEGMITFRNDRFIKVFGYTTDDVPTINEWWLNAYPDVDYRQLVIQNWNAAVEHAIKNDSDIKSEVYHVTCKNARVREIVISGSIINEDLLATFVDISERKQAEEALQKSEIFFRSVWEHSTSGMRITDDYGTIISVNKAYCTMVGKNEKELVGSNFSIIYSEKEKLRITQKHTERFITKTVPAFMEKEVLLWNGKKMWFEVLNSFLEFGDSKRLLLGIFTDVTERKRAEEIQQRQLKELQLIYQLGNSINRAVSVDEIYEKAMDSLLITLKADRVSILLFGTDGRVHFKAWRGLSDEYRKAVDGHSPWTLDTKNPQPICVQDVEQELSMEHFRPIFSKEGLKALGFFPLLYQEKLLGKFMIYYNTEHFFSEKEIQLTQTIAFHIAFAIERKRAEELLKSNELKFRTVADYTYDWEFWKNEEEQIVYISPSCERITGYTQIEFISDPLLVEKIIHSEDKTSMSQHFMDVHSEEHKDRMSETEYRIINKNGSTVNIHHICRPIYDEHHKYLGRRVSNRDITERKNSEQIIRDLQRRESLGVLAGGIAHDFNNLLAAMMGNISLAKIRMPIDHPSIKNLDRTLSAMERAATLTKQMLAYSGKGIFQIMAVDLVKTVQEHINLFEASLPKNVTFETHLSPTPVFVKGDPGQIEQIVMNLIINGGEAIEGKQGVVTITVSTVTLFDKELLPYGALNNQVLANGEYAFFQVSDNGIGMNEETLVKIFDPFFTTKFVGRGLGLSAVLGIIRGHGGGITVKSSESAGTTVQVLLPLYTSKIDSTQTKELSATPVIQIPSVLVIDDEQYIVELAHDIFGIEKYQHRSATDPEKGLQLFKEHWQTIDVVILDYAMPKMNGREVLIELRKINPNVKVIMSSGFSEEELVHLMGDVTPNAIIQKPHTVQALMAVINKVLFFS